MRQVIGMALALATALPHLANAQIVPNKRDTVMTGKVAHLKLLLKDNPPGPGQHFYCEVIIKNQKDSLTFKLARGVPEKVDQFPKGDDYFAVPYSAVALAMIATLREAYWQGSDVTVHGEQQTVYEILQPPALPGNPPAQPKKVPVPVLFFQIRDVTLTR